ncbi:MAG: DNA mismatch repair protein MutS [Clostridium butyricum]|nr:DNA mismatch repair protein MutS [Clostridium butyricum]
MNDIARNFYKKNALDHKKNSNLLDRKGSMIGWSRLILLLALMIIDYFLYKKNNYNMIIIVSMLGVLIFLILVIYHNNILERKKREEILLEINDKGIKRLNGKFNEFEDRGIEFVDENHSYINDLDVFGDNSIFQYINTTVTKGGRILLSNLLKLNVKLSKEEIKLRQEAVKELGEKIEYRQNLFVEGTLNQLEEIDLKFFIDWNKRKNKFSLLRTVIACIFILVTIISIYFVVGNVLPESFLLLNLLVNYVVVKILSSGISEEIKLFESMKDIIHGYAKILNLIEEEKFNSRYLKNIYSKLNNENISCKVEISKLDDILDWIGNSKYNAYYLLLNVLVFSDVFLMKRLYKWREKNGSHIEEWISVMSEMDALSSISNLAFENPDWVYPDIYDENIIEGKNIGHPLIGLRVVKNNFKLRGNHKAALITGSNMSGKSTFLRTIGINLLLSYIGAPVCAEKFSCGIMNIYTCMRTRDNLQESISSFYAEILRIKLLIEACQKGEKVFFLLDEIFKGTNSRDRHIGAKVLINQLIEHGGVGIVSTHDLELCDLEYTNSKITNYNFREYYENNKIKFDYILRKGKSETQNAIHLMKLAGIEVGEGQ